MSTHEDRVEKLLGSLTGDYGGELPPAQSRIEALIHKVIEEALGGLPIHTLTAGQYDPTTGMPTISDPVENEYYLVPSRDDSSNLFDEWVYVDGRWEKFGVDDSKPSRYKFTVTVPTTGWELYQPGLYFVRVPLEGSLATDDGGDASVVQTGTESTDAMLRAAFTKFTRISSENGAIVVYSVEIPDIAVPLRLEVLR